MNNSSQTNLNYSINFNISLKSPIKANSVLGELVLIANNNIVATADIINTNEIKKKSIYFYFTSFFKNYPLILSTHQEF